MEPEKANTVNSELDQQIELLQKPPHQRNFEDLMKLIGSLSQSSFFQNLDPTIRVQTCRAMQLEVYGPGKIIFAEGDPGDQLYIILEGSVGVCVKEVVANDLIQSRMPSRCGTPLGGREMEGDAGGHTDSCDPFGLGNDCSNRRDGGAGDAQDSAERPLTQAQVSTLSLAIKAFGAGASRLSMLPEEDCEPQEQQVPDATMAEEAVLAGGGGALAADSVAGDLLAASWKLSEVASEEDESSSEDEVDDEDQPKAKDGQRRDSFTTKHSQKILQRSNGFEEEGGCRARRLGIAPNALEHDNREEPGSKMESFAKKAQRRASVPVRPLAESGSRSSAGGIGSTSLAESGRRNLAARSGTTPLAESARRNSAGRIGSTPLAESVRRNSAGRIGPSTGGLTGMRRMTVAGQGPVGLRQRLWRRTSTEITEEDEEQAPAEKQDIDHFMPRRCSFQCKTVKADQQNSRGAVQNLKACLAQRLSSLENDTARWLESKKIAARPKTPIRKRSVEEEEIYFSESSSSSSDDLDSSEDEPNRMEGETKLTKQMSKMSMNSDMRESESTRDGDGIFSGAESDDDSYLSEHDMDDEGDGSTSDVDLRFDADSGSDGTGEPASETTASSLPLQVLRRRASAALKSNLVGPKLPTIQISQCASHGPEKTSKPKDERSGAKDRWSLFRRVAIADNLRPKTTGKKIERRPSLAGGLLLSRGVEVAVLSKGAVFGEVALKSNQPRSATIRTKTRTYVATLSRDDYMRILHDAVQSQQKERYEFLKTLPLCKGMSESSLHRLGALMQPRTLQRSERVYEYGEPIIQVFIAISGQFSVCCPAEEVNKEELQSSPIRPPAAENNSKPSAAKAQDKRQEGAFITTAQIVGPAVFGLSCFLRGERHYSHKIVCQTSGGSIYCVLAKELVQYLGRDTRKQMEKVAHVEELFHANRMRVLQPISSQSTKRSHHRCHNGETLSVDERLQLARGDIAPAHGVYSLEGRLQTIKGAFKQCGIHCDESPTPNGKENHQQPPVQGLEAAVDIPLSVQPLWCMEVLQKQCELRASMRGQAREAARHAVSLQASEQGQGIVQARSELGCLSKAAKRSTARIRSTSAPRNVAGLQKSKRDIDAPKVAPVEEPKASIEARRLAEAAHENDSRLKLAFDRKVFHCTRPSLEKSAGVGGVAIPSRPRLDMLDLEMDPGVEKSTISNRLGNSKWLKRRLEALGVGQEGRQALQKSVCKAPGIAMGLGTFVAGMKTKSLAPIASTERAIMAKDCVETPPTTAGTTTTTMESDCDLAMQSTPWWRCGFFADALCADADDLLSPPGVRTPRPLQHSGKLEGLWFDRPATTGQLPERAKQSALNLQDVYRHSQKTHPLSIAAPKRPGGSPIAKGRGRPRTWQSIVC